MNSINIIKPYRHAGQWVFDDETVGLLKEPFIAGIDGMIDKMVAKFHKQNNAFIMLFSNAPFPGYQYQLEWLREEAGGNWYFANQFGMEGWLCPALFKYFDKAPQCIYIQTKYRKPSQYVKIATFWEKYPEAIVTLKAMWEAGDRVKEIALAMRHMAPGQSSPSRSAIIAKSHRIGLPHHANSNKTKLLNAAIGRKTRPRAQPRKKRTYTEFQEIPYKIDGIKDIPPETSEFAVSLREVKSKQCRWPLTSEPFMFCGAPKIEHSSWCLHHSSRVFKAAQPKRDSKFIPYSRR